MNSDRKREADAGTNQTWPDLWALPYIQFSASRCYVRNRRISISIIPWPGRPLFPRPRLTLMKPANSSPSRISRACERRRIPTLTGGLGARRVNPLNLFRHRLHEPEQKKRQPQKAPNTVTTVVALGNLEEKRRHGVCVTIRYLAFKIGLL